MKKITKQQLIDELIQANEICRAAYQLAKRKGKATDWSTFSVYVEKGLESQHKILYAENLH